MSLHGREAVSVENNQLRVTVLREGGHIAEILHKKLGVSPLWIPPWPSGEPSAYDPHKDREYGQNHESKLLMGIMGHNLCLPVFGPPSAEEGEAGLTVHGEASVVRYQIESHEAKLSMNAEFPLAGLWFERTLSLAGDTILFEETVSNKTALDQPIAWTQHVTLGPPFVTPEMQIMISAARSRTFESPDFDGGVLMPGADFKWPFAPLASGGTLDLRVFSGANPNADSKFSRFTTHLMEQGAPGGFTAFSPEHKLAIGYQWKRDDFPWLGLWQENKKRNMKPWNGDAVTCGLEFGVSPFPETRRQMISRAPLFGTPGYRWLAAKQSASVAYSAFVRSAERLCEVGL